MKNYNRNFSKLKQSKNETVQIYNNYIFAIVYSKC
jgi:uncharacterized membrane protein